MEQKYLIDSNPVIDFFNGKLTAGGKNFIAAIDPVVSVITHTELLDNKNIPWDEWVQLLILYK